MPEAVCNRVTHGSGRANDCDTFILRPWCLRPCVTGLHMHLGQAVSITIGRGRVYGIGQPEAGNTSFEIWQSPGAAAEEFTELLIKYY